MGMYDFRRKVMYMYIEGKSHEGYGLVRHWSIVATSGV